MLPKSTLPPLPSLPTLPKSIILANFSNSSKSHTSSHTYFAKANVAFIAYTTKTHNFTNPPYPNSSKTRITSHTHFMTFALIANITIFALITKAHKSIYPYYSNFAKIDIVNNSLNPLNPNYKCLVYIL